MEITDSLDKRLLQDIQHSSGVPFTPHPDNTIFGTQNTKAAWSILHTDAVERAVRMYVNDTISERELEVLIGYALEHQGDPYDVFEF